MRGRGGTRCLEAGRGRRRGVCAYAPADNKIEGTEPEEQRMRPVGGDLGRVGGETRALPAALVG